MSSSDGAVDGPFFRLEHVCVAYGDRTILRELSLCIRAREMVALLGRNGAGKSTLLRVLNGVLSPSRGAVYLEGVPISGLSRKMMARRVAVVPQHLHVPFAFTVRDVVAMGRTAHIPFLASERADDRREVDAALELLEMDDLAGRAFNSLSGGEQQRAVVAMAVCQQPRALLLDEPTVHLDLAHQLAVLQLARRLHDERGMTVLAAVHDVNLAALLFDRLIFLHGARIAADGPPSHVVTPETIARVFDAHVDVYRHPTRGVPQVTLLP